MTRRGEVEPVLVPEATVLQRRLGPDVHDQCAGAPGYLTYARVELPEPRRQAGRRPPRAAGPLDHGEHDRRDTCIAQRRDGRGVSAYDGRHVAAGTQHVVGPRMEGDHVGTKREGCRDLGGDRVQEPTADGQVRVAETAFVHCQRGRDAIGPAQVAPGRPEVVLEPFGERVTEGDERARALHPISSRAV